MFDRLAALRSHLWSAGSVLLSALPLAAQCGFDWQPGAGVPGPDNRVYALARSPNGDVIAGGDFRVADQAVANRIARWNGTTWLPLGAGVDSTVLAVAVLPNGDVIAGGTFATAGGVAASNIARWDGASWSPLGLGTNSPVTALSVLPNGDLIVGGAFTQAGGVTANRVARWDGVGWSTFGSGLGLGQVGAIAYRSGELFFGGTFLSAGGAPAVGLARWDGVGWSAIPGIGNQATVDALYVLPNGDVVIGGLLLIGSQLESLATWNGSSLQVLSPPVSPVRGIATIQGDLVVGGTVPSGSVASVARFDGTTWADITDGAPALILAMLDATTGTIVAAGQPAGPVPALTRAVTSYDGQGWSNVSAFAPARYFGLQRLANGDVVVGGDFDEIDGVAANNVARWNGTTWLPLGLGVDGPVTGLALAANGDLLVGGDFLAAGGAPAQRVARWNGTTWATVGALDFAPYRMAATATGQILAVRGTPGPGALFDGQTWGPLGAPGITTVIVNGLVSLPGGDVVLGGLFIAPTAVVPALLYDGSSFTVIDPGRPGLASALGIDELGRPLLSGTLDGVQAIARLVNGSWQVITNPAGFNGQIRALTSLPNGDLLVGGNFELFGAQLASRIARFDGSSWSGVDGGLIQGGVDRLVLSGAGELFVTGTFFGAGDQGSAGRARATPQCAASVAPFGAGCTGSAGAVILAADGLPWAGSTFRTTASGMAQLSLGLHIVGTNPTTLPLPLAAAGCSLLVEPVFLDVLFPNGGTVEAPFAIPNTPGLVGQLLRTQVIGLELAASLAIVQTTSTNALELTIGAL